MATVMKPSVRTMDEAFHELLEADTNSANVTAAMRRDQPLEPGPALVPVARYTSREYHELEKQRLWSRVWQMACHEDDFPNVGDVVPYDIADKSYLVVRVADDEFKAYYNACLHRGRKLREVRARGLTELRCAFHGWAWNLDGTLKQVPCAYDFTDMDREEESLPEVKIGRWGRFIFINPDPDCAPLEEHLGDLASQFEVLPYERRYKQAHVAKVIRANWKAVQEAFMESYHVLLTHPQILTGGANDMCTKYDAFGNYSRAIRCGALEGEGLPDWDDLPMGGDPVRIRHPLNGWVYEDLGNEVVQVTTPKGVTGKFTVDADWIEGELTDANPHLCNAVGGRQLPPEAAGGGSRPMADPDAEQRAREKLGNNASPRAMAAQSQREMLRSVIPSVADGIPDIELSSAIFLTVFPNWHPWGSFNRINYRFRPNGDNHEEAIMECMYLAPIPEDGDYTPVSEIHWLDPDDDWTDAVELGGLTKVFNQDVRNLPHVYQGMKATARENLRLGDYNELKLRHFHKLYGEWVDGD
jgi:nitrite reductase/ring-hydroxylating ferredoxin subunit